MSQYPWMNMLLKGFKEQYAALYSHDKLQYYTPEKLHSAFQIWYVAYVHALSGASEDCRIRNFIDMKKVFDSQAYLIKNDIENFNEENFVKDFDKNVQI
jgi:hypothetical protein